MKRASVWLWMLCMVAGAYASADLAKEFVDPPASAKPDVWWHWMDGSITQEGITADLEAMRRVGIGSFQMFNLKASPLGPVRMLSPEWRELVKHTGKEAERLGLKMAMHNCPGWSSSGGPWNTPENAMQCVTYSETRVRGASATPLVLPQPPAKLDFYRDIAVLAFPVTAGEDVAMAACAPRVTASVMPVQGEHLFDGRNDTFLKLPMPGRDTPQFIQFEFTTPFAARSAAIKLAHGFMDVRGAIQVSDDGQSFRDVKAFVFPRPGTTGLLNMSLGVEPVVARFYRVVFTVGGLKAPHVAVAEVDFSPCLRIGDIEAKSGMNDGRFTPDVEARATGPVSPELVVNRKTILDLTRHMQPDGTLNWTPPPGEWVVLRLGHTPIGKVNREAAEAGHGLECDKMSAAALDAHWNGYVQKVLDDLGPLVGRGKTFDSVLIDSYEVGGQNWTPGFREEFQRRCGYDLLPFLVTFTGRVVDQPAISERFLWDMRRTIADLFAENYFGHFRKLCHERGLTASVEPYTGPFESLQVGAEADLPMGEFWIGNFYNSIPTAKLAASSGHIHGCAVIGAEAFTSAPSAEHGRWLDDPFALKAMGDLIFCQGVNRYSLHRFAHQPWTNRFPGMAMGQWGTHFDRTSTWFEQAHAWMRYVTRCQHMLRQGRFVADVAYFYGESAPMEYLENDPALPVGYDFDGINAAVLMKKAAVKDGCLTLESGMRYRVLVLPATDRVMSPALLRKLREFVRAGLTLVGPPPLEAPGLTDYPRPDQEVQTLVAEMWGRCDGHHVTENIVGEGRVVWGRPLDEVLAGLNVPPDFEFTSPDGAQLMFTHRRTESADIYFVSNQRDLFCKADVLFRVEGRVPEVWHPDSGRMAPASVWRVKAGRTEVPLSLDPAGSVFVVFRRPADQVDAVVSARRTDDPPPAAAPRLEIRRAVYEALDGSGSLDVTKKLQRMVRAGTLRVEAGNAGIGEDPARFRPKQLRVEYVLDGEAQTRVVEEEKFLEIGVKASVGEPPLWEMIADKADRVAVHTALPGVFEGQMASGRRWKAEVPSVPTPMDVTGPWILSFPPHGGAPPRVVLPELISWSRHHEEGVRYFSGTATYARDLQIPATLLKAGHTLMLDLGRVKNIAEVWVNGQSLGVLWKPPFRVDITDAVRPGSNQLEIKVTNLWPNRLIGDEQRPADCEWGAAKQLKKWPAWVWEDKPSPSGRLTFTTWHHWTKDDALIESGLLGPVRVVCHAHAEIRVH